MKLQDRLERDLKTALLSGDKQSVETIKSLKNALQYQAVSLKVNKGELKDEQIQQVFAREAKKRQEAAELYEKVGDPARASIELAEKKIIDEYLPAKLSDEEVLAIAKDEIGKLENPSPSDMGRVIGQVRARLGPQADGAQIARLVKQNLESQ